MAYVVYKDTVDYISKIAEYSEKYSRVTLEKIGMEIREAITDKAKTYAKKRFFYRGMYEANNGSRYMRLKMASSMKNPYERYKGNVRISGEPSRLPYDLTAFIRSRPYHQYGKVVIGWLDTGQYTTLLKNGRGSNIQSGTRVSKMGERMENGGTIDLSARSQRMLRASGFRSKRTIKLQAYPIIGTSFGVAQQRAQMKAMQQYYKMMEEYGNGNKKLRSA